MNRLQRAFLVCGLAGIVSLCIYPPWDSDLIRIGGLRVTSIAGHGWIFHPPPKCWGGPSVTEERIAFSRLGLEAGSVAGITAIAVTLAGWRKTAKPAN